MTTRTLKVLKDYLLLSGKDRLDFLKELNKVEKMNSFVKRDYEKTISELPLPNFST